MLLFICSASYIYVRCCAVAGEYSGGPTKEVPGTALPGKMVRLTAQQAKCGYERNTVGPPGGARRGFLEEVMSTLRSEGGVALVSQ